jgi:hypothetical protein
LANGGYGQLCAFTPDAALAVETNHAVSQALGQRIEALGQSASRKLTLTLVA